MFEQVTDATYTERFAAVEAGICLCYKKLCPHCKNMEKVMEKFRALQPDVTLLCMDIEEETAAPEAFDAKRAPTMLIIKQGKVAAIKAGLMNPKELLALYKSA